MSIGNKIRSLREKRGWSQLFLAEKVGINNSVLSRIESDKRDVEDYLLIKFADLFGVTTDYLLGRTDSPHPTVTVAGQQVELTPEQYKVFQEMKKHPKFVPMFHDLATDTEKKVKQLIDMWEFLKKQIEQDDGELGNEFGELED